MSFHLLKVLKQKQEQEQEQEGEQRREQEQGKRKRVHKMEGWVEPVVAPPSAGELGSA